MGKTNFNRLVGKFKSLFTEDPEGRIAQGFYTDIEDFSNPTVEQQDHDLKRSKRLLREFEKCSKRGLSFDQKLDLELAKLALEQDIFSGEYTYNDKTWLEQMPMGGDIGDGMFRLYINDPRPAEERLNNITAIIEKAPWFLREHLRTLDTPVSRWVDIDLDRIRELPDLFDTIYRWAEENDYGQLRRLEKASDKLKQKVLDYKKKLKAMPTTQNFVIGEDQAQELVRLKGIDYSLEELNHLARDFLTDTDEKLAELRGKLVARYNLPKNTSNHKLHCHLNKIYAVPLEEIIGQYHEDLDEVLDFIKRRQLFEIPEDQEIKIIQTPKFLEPLLPAGAMDCPPPFREGVKTSIVYLTLGPKLVDEHTRIKIPGMTVHECIPGHHLQYATGYGNDSDVRKLFDAMEHAEGWTTMLEQYMLDKGLMERWEDEARFVSILDLARLGARVAIDLYFMTGNIDHLDVGVNYGKNTGSPFANAEKLLRKVTGFTPHRAEIEVDWYSQSPGYPLSYLVGNKMVWDLKRDLTVAQEGEMSEHGIDKEFHRVYLESGCMPVKYLRAVFEHEGLIPKL